MLIGSIVGIAFLYDHLQQKEEHEFPERREELEIQGLTWKTIAYYYHPGIYEEQYNPESNLRLISKAIDIGVNLLLVKGFSNCTKDGEMIGDDEEAE